MKRIFLSLLIILAGAGCSDSRLVIVSADAGSDARVDENGVGMLDGSASSSSPYAITSYEWQQISGPPVELADAGGVTTAFTAPVVSEDTTLTFRLTVTDQQDHYSTDTVSVTVANVNNPMTELRDDDAAANSLLEGAPAGTYAGITLATDETDADDIVSLNLLNFRDEFEILTADGTVVTRQPLDFEAEETFALQFAATSTDGSMVTLESTVTLIDNAEPALTLEFPLAGATFSDTLTFRGTAVDAEAHAVTVSIDGPNGSAETVVAADGTWSLTVHSLVDDIELEIVAIDEFGESASLDYRVEQQLPMYAPSIMSRIGPGNYLLLDEYLNVVFRYSEQSNELVPLLFESLDAAQGADYLDFVYDPAANAIYLTNNADDSITRVQLDSLAASVISSPSVGRGPDIEIPIAIELAPDGNSLYVSDTLNDNIVQVDIASGDRTVFTSPVIGGGESFDLVTDLCLDGNGGLLLSDLGDSAILRADLASGFRTVVGSNDVGNGDLFSKPRRIACDTAHGMVYTINTQNKTIIALDMATMERTLVASNQPQYGEFISRLTDIEVVPGGGPLLLPNVDRANVISLDLVTQRKEVYYRYRSGSPPYLDSLTSLDIDETTGVLMAAGFDGDIVRIDPRSGVKISALTEYPQATLWQSIRSLAVADSDSVRLVDYESKNIYAFDFSTGMQSMVADLSNKNVLSLAREILFDPDNQRNVLLDSDKYRSFYFDEEEEQFGPLRDSLGSGDNEYHGYQGAFWNRSMDAIYTLDSTLIELYAFDSNSGAALFVEGLDYLPGVQFRDLTYDNDGDEFYLLDGSSSGALVRLAGDFSANETVSDNFSSPGIPTRSPRHLASDFGRNIHYVADTALAAVIAIDGATGQRVLIAN